MRISKIKTKVGELCTPVSAELSAVVERMRSGNNKEAAERIATSARLSKALEEAGDNVEHCVQQLADYCAKAHLGEEDSVERTRWQSRFRTLSEDVIRKIFCLQEAAK